MAPVRDESRFGGMAGSGSDGGSRAGAPSSSYDLPPGISLKDIQVDPDLDSVTEEELGIEVI